MASTSLRSADETAGAIRAALREGHREEARTLAAALRIEWPEDARGWLWSALLHEAPAEARLFARHAARLQPGPVTERALRWTTRRANNPAMPPLAGEQLLQIGHYLDGPISPPPAIHETKPPASPPRLERLQQRLSLWRARVGWFALFLVIAVGIGLFAGRRPAEAPVPAEAEAPADGVATLQAEASELWKQGRREAALAKWNRALEQAPARKELRQTVARSHVAISSEHLRRGDPAAARPHLERAYELAPEEAVVQREYRALVTYLDGQRAIAERNWSLAVELLGPLYNLDPDYLDVKKQMKIALTGEQQAQAEQRARQGQTLSRVRMAGPGRTARALVGPSAKLYNLPGQTTLPASPPGASDNKHVVVSIEAQRMYVYQNGRLIWDWPASTGEEEMPTAPGQYRIQSKIERARSEIHSLWMPYWQGIYWVDSIENGIHGQVTFDDGGRLWDGYLGTQITFGCVMIADEQAEKLFRWTDVGTAVSILASWPPHDRLPVCPAGTTGDGIEMPCYSGEPAIGGG